MIDILEVVMRLFAGLLALLATVSVAHAADHPISSEPAPIATFGGGVSIYAPYVLFNASAPSGQQYKMWYGGWEAVGQTYDDIYYRTSSDGKTWSNYTTVLTGSQFMSAAGITSVAGQSCSAPNTTCFAAVNNPSVSVLTNGVTGQTQYTMFFATLLQAITVTTDSKGKQTTTTVSAKPVWSMVSSNGTSWSTPVQFDPTTAYHNSTTYTPDTADVVAFIGGTGSDPTNTVWHLYWQNDSDLSHFYMSLIDGNRQIITSSGPLQVLQRQSSAGLVNLHVAKIGSNWEIFFNEFAQIRQTAVPSVDGQPFDSTVDAFADISANSESWASASVQQLTAAEANPVSLGQVCGILTPFALPMTSTTYRLYFGLSTFTPDPLNSAALICNTTIAPTMYYWDFTQ